MIEHWVLGFTVRLDGDLEDLSLAEVLGVEGGAPGRLRLGEAILLGTDGRSSPFSRSFEPADEPLFGDDQQWGEEVG